MHVTKMIVIECSEEDLKILIDALKICEDEATGQVHRTGYPSSVYTRLRKDLENA